MYAAAVAKSLQSCPTLCNPLDGSPPGSAIPGILQARTLEWVAIAFSNAWEWKVKVKPLSRVRLFTTPWTAAYQALLPKGFSRQEYWSGLPLPSPKYIYNCRKVGSQDTLSNRQIWTWSTKWSRSKANRVLPRERTGYSKHPLPTTQEKTLHMGFTRCQYRNQIDNILCSQNGEALYSQQKQDQELTVAQVMNSSLPNSDLNWGK